MKILSPEQMKEADQFTICHEPILSIDLMERASRALVNKFIQSFDSSTPIHIFCGYGNNGGDGLAIARMLHSLTYEVKVYVLHFANHFSEEHLINRDRLSNLKIEVNYIYSIEDIQQFKPKGGVLIDAIFGYGLNKPLSNAIETVINYINLQPIIIVSVDMPSGLFAHENTIGKVVHADLVYTFQIPKLALLLPCNESYIKKWELIDIGLMKEAIQKQKTNYYYTTFSDIQLIYQKRKPFSHKGTYGHLLLIAGSKGKVGAAILAAKAALRAGVGLVTLYLPKELTPIPQTALPEVMCWVKSKDELLKHLKNHPYNTLAIGPGIGLESQTIEFFTSILTLSNQPIVIDADGLNIIGEHKYLLDQIPVDSILTPHPGEFRRLVGDWEDDFHKLKLLQELAMNYQIIIVLKGANTSICNSDGTIYFNSTGNNGMATAGSGDTLTGIIAGLLAQNYTPIHAAHLGVYLHGLAGDLALENENENSLIASDITKYLGKAFHKIDS